MKHYYFYTLKALWDGQGKIKMNCGMSQVKKPLSGKRFIMQRNNIFFDTSQQDNHNEAFI